MLSDRQRRTKFARAIRAAKKLQLRAANKPGYGSNLRACGGCSAWLLTENATQITIYCPKCYPKYVTPFDQWAANLKLGDVVYVQPSVSWRGLSRSKYVIVGGIEQAVALQLLGVPEARITTSINQLAQHDMTPRLKYALD